MTVEKFTREAEKLFTLLEKSEEVTYLGRYKGNKDEFYLYYSCISGRFKGGFFIIYVHKSSISERVYISDTATTNSKELKTFLDSLTELKFDIV